MEKQFEVEIFNQKILKESNEFISKVIQFQAEVVDQVERLDRDFNNMFNKCSRDFNAINLLACKNASKAMNDIIEDEERKIADIRKTKFIPPLSIPNAKKPSKPAFNHKILRLSTKWKPNKIPRPVWGIILDFCDLSLLITLEKVCKMIFLLINPVCECTATKGSSQCYSLWRRFSLPNTLPDPNCSLVRKLNIRQNLVKFLEECLTQARNLCCSKKIHNWEPHPNNPNVIRCVCCLAGAKRLDYCASHCSTHKKICQNPYEKFSICRNHACILCRFPEISPSISTITSILLGCQSYSFYPSLKIVLKSDIKLE